MEAFQRPIGRAVSSAIVSKQIGPKRQYFMAAYNLAKKV